MKFCFWQNIVSIHQAPFLEALAKKHEVVLMVEEQLIASRAKEGWNVPEIAGVRIYEMPSGKELERAFSDKNVHHIFSGINGFPGVYSAFLESMRHNVSMSIIAEPFNYFGIKGFLRRLKYRRLFKLHGDKISALFPTGKMGVSCYRRCGFPVEKIHQWGYFTSSGDFLTKWPSSPNRLRWLFVGGLIERKNILSFLKTLYPRIGQLDEFAIVGTGHLMNKIQDLAKSTTNIRILGSVDNRNIGKVISQYDLLILPSLFDGWGAVVNEALTAGTRVLCSDRCGAAVLIDDAGVRGRVFPLDKMEQAITEELQREPLNIPRRREIAEWAHSHISGDVAADYFASCFTGSENKPVAPWLKTTI